MRNIMKYIENIEFKNILALIITSVWLYIHIYCVSKNCNLDKELITNFNIIEAMIVGYYFGSSYGSNKKDILLQDVNEQLGKKKCEETHE